MKILSHRGYWKQKEEQNSETAIIRSLDSGFGFESDIRDNNGKLVISHEMPDSDCLSIDHVFIQLKQYHNKYCFAINIKSDGIVQNLKKKLKEYNIQNYFVFDMSIPQMLEYKEHGLMYFTRQSEYEINPVLYKDANGIWIDSFDDESWITEELLKTHLDNEKKVCIVSSELHGRCNKSLWRFLRNIRLDNELVYLCTDLPNEADAYFNNTCI